MSENQYLKKTANGVPYLDYKDFLGVPGGILLRDNGLYPCDVDNFLTKTCYSAVENKIAAKENCYHLIRLNQKHTNIVVSAKEISQAPADGVFTDSAEYILLVKTADCFPVFLYDGSTIGLLHLGWRSVFAGILGNFFYALPDFNIEQARAVIGPGIDSCCFEVSSEVFILFDEKYRLSRKDKFFIDLKRLILDELTGFGIKYILTSESCTVCNKELFHSYRREGPEVKHMLSYISLGG